MKKITRLLLVFVFVLLSLLCCFSLIACSSSEPQAQNGELQTQIEAKKQEVNDQTNALIQSFKNENDKSAWQIAVYEDFLTSYSNELCLRFDDVKNGDELQSVYGSIYRMLRDADEFFTLSHTVTINTPVDQIFESDENELEYSISHFNSTNLGSSSAIGTLYFSTSSDGISFKVVSDFGKIIGTGENLDDVANGYSHIISDDSQYAVLTENTETGGSYAGVIVYKNGQIVGYTSLHDKNGNNWESVNFDLSNQPQLSDQKVIDLMIKARLGQSGEDENNFVLYPNKMSYADQFSVTTSGNRFSSDRPSILFPNVGTNCEYEVWSNRSFVYDNNEISSAKISGGEKIRLTENASSGSIISAIRYNNDQISGVSVIKVKEISNAALGNPLTIAYPINLSIIVNPSLLPSNSVLTSAPRALALAYINYLASSNL